MTDTVDGKLVTSPKKVGILILSSAAGTAIGYGVFLFVSLGLLVIMRRRTGRARYKILREFFVYGVFGITTLLGFGLGLFIVTKSEKSAS
jgi:hypothetical protein